MTGLNLMRLLVQNRIAEFHTELEVLPAEASACHSCAWVHASKQELHACEDVSWSTASLRLFSQCLSMRLFVHAW